MNCLLAQALRNRSENHGAGQRVGGKLHTPRSHQATRVWRRMSLMESPAATHPKQQAHTLRPCGKHACARNVARAKGGGEARSPGNKRRGSGFPGPPEVGHTGIGRMRRAAMGGAEAGGDWPDKPMGGTGARRLAGCGAAR